MNSSEIAADILNDPPLMEDFDGLNVDVGDIAQTLIQLKLIPAMCFSDTLLPARQKFQATAAQLLKKAAIFVNDLNVPYKKSQIEAFAKCDTVAHCSNFQNEMVSKEIEGASQHITVLQSRYFNDYKEISCLGKGGFGQVHKVKSYIDDQYYAVKKISFDLNNSDLCIKALREVKILSRLNHPNIVRYYGAWLEFAPPVGHITSSQRPADSLREINGSRHCQISELKRSDDESTTNVNDRSSLRLSNSSPSIVFEDKDKEASLSIENPNNRQLALANQHELIRTSLSGENICAGRDDSVSSGTSNGSDHTNAINHRKNIRQLWPSARSLVLYLKMELGNTTLRDWINDRNDSIPPSSNNVFLHVDSKRNERLIKQMLEGLNYIHQLGITHRDIKPSNILVSRPEERVLLGDFGLACLTANDNCIEDTASCEVATSTNSIKILNCAKNRQLAYRSSGIGTLSYSAPEQLRSHYYNQKADMFSIGVIMFELYFPFRTCMERMHNFMDLKSGKICSEFQCKWPIETLLINRLVQNHPASRPTAKELLDSDFFQSSNDLITALKEEVQYLKFENQKLQRENLILNGVIDSMKNSAHAVILRKA